MFSTVMSNFRLQPAGDVQDSRSGSPKVSWTPLKSYQARNRVDKTDNILRIGLIGSEKLNRPTTSKRDT